MLLLKKTHDRTMFAFFVAILTETLRKIALYFAIVECFSRIIGAPAAAVLFLVYFPFYLWSNSYNRVNHPDERVL